ncbi:MAG: cyclodeaminase/cyclohydrolase family protein, partial [Prolixibacteraceae bacterium]|nr:cyclodeaminase/cyclohydrolase family protein [Prolixibacteraceae bacterium]
SANKRGWDHRWDEFSLWADKGKMYHNALLKLVDDDTRAFNAIMEAFALPKNTEKEKAERKLAIARATKHAIEVPLKVMELCLASMEVMKAMAQIGNPNSISDACVGAIAARAGLQGAFLNVKINAKDFDDAEFVQQVLNKAKELEKAAIILEADIMSRFEEFV